MTTARTHTSLVAALKDPERVTSLDLRRKKLTKFPDELECLRNLELLDLSSNPLREIPESIGSLKKLVTLRLGAELGRRPIKNLPESMGALVRLRELDVSFLGLTTFPPQLARLRKLENLNLRSNKLRDLLGVGELTGLVCLDISYNYLKELPDELTKLRRLRELRMSCAHDSKFRRIRDDLRKLGKLAKLETLFLLNAGLKELPVEEICLLTHLKELNLRYNDIKEIPEEVKRLPQLRKIEYGSKQTWRRN
jgi:Leucine-rich repeat (LRR) protein